MLHPIFSVLITKPELVMEHVAGYASLLREETSSVGKEVARRAVAWGVTLFASLVFLVIALIAAVFGFGGVAAGAASIAKLLFFVFVVLALAALIASQKRKP